MEQPISTGEDLEKDLKARTYRKHHRELTLALDHDGKVVSDLEAAESLVDEDILDP